MKKSRKSKAVSQDVDLNSMTVGDMIEYLKIFDPNLPLMAADREETGGFMGITSVVGGVALIHTAKVKIVDSNGQIWYTDAIGDEDKVIGEFDAAIVEW